MIATKGLLTQASKSAHEAPKRDIGEVVAGPFDVGNIGTVSVVKRQAGSEQHLYGVYTPHSGRQQRMPLAAIATLAETQD